MYEMYTREGAFGGVNGLTPTATPRPLPKLSPDKTRRWGFVSPQSADECIHGQKVYVNNYSGSVWMNEII